MVESNKKRLHWVDLTKLFAIFLVLWGHGIQHFTPSFRESEVYIWIYSFHMPLFMMLAGLFMGEDKLREGLKFIIKRFYQLILPSILWISLAFILSYIIGRPTHNIIRCLWFDLWFLKSLFACCLILTLSYMAIRQMTLTIIVSLMISQITLFTPYLWHLQIQTMLPSLVAGLFLSNKLRGGVTNFYFNYCMYRFISNRYSGLDCRQSLSSNRTD